MARKRSVMIWLVAVVNIVFGGMLAIGNTVEVVSGTTFSGMQVNATAGVLGMAGAIFAFLLLLGGVGTWRVEPYGRKLSLIAATGLLLANVLALILLDIPLSFLAVGGLYPLILLIVFNLPAWRRKFAADGAMA